MAVGVGSSICGGSAIAATAPVIDADDEEVAQAISVIFFFNVLAALIFPAFGKLIGFNTMTGESFGIFKTLSKFFIVLAMAAIGLNTNIVKLIKTGGKPLVMGFCCWVGITGVSLLMQKILGLF